MFVLTWPMDKKCLQTQLQAALSVWRSMLALALVSILTLYNKDTLFYPDASGKSTAYPMHFLFLLLAMITTQFDSADHNKYNILEVSVLFKIFRVDGLLFHAVAE